MKQEEYILGSHREELYRLGLQHQVWASEAQRGWEIAGFKPGDTILDIGCGPGFCTTELGYRVGPRGKVIGVDISDTYIDFVQHAVQQHGLQVEILQGDLQELSFEKESLDGTWCRWVLAWLHDVSGALDNIVPALKPGATMVFQEYFDWKVFQMMPERQHLTKGIAACLKSFKDSHGDIDIGRYLPRMLAAKGLEIISTRPISKMARGGDQTWEWPRSFLEIYMPAVADMGLINHSTVELAQKELKELTNDPHAIALCPVVIEVVARKPK